MKKRLALLLAVVLVMTAMLTGCGKKDNTSAENGTKTEGDQGTQTDDAKEPEDGGDKTTSDGKKVVIKMTKWGEAGVETQLAEEFNAAHDDIELQVDAIPGDGYGDRLTTSFSSGDGYDIFASGEGDFYKWVELGMVASLDEYIANDKDWVNAMDENIMKMGVVDGKQSYLIKDYNPICLWYNKDMFDAAGVAYPADSWTWDDLYNAAKQLTKKNDKGEFETFGFHAQSWGYAVASYLESKGLSYLSEDNSTADGYLNSPEMAEALDTYFGWAEGDDRISPNTADTDSYGDSTAMMINGKLAMMITGGWAKQGLGDAGTNYATALVPGNHKAYFCAGGYAISETSKNKDAAWEVLKWITGERASELRAETEAVFPTAQQQLDEVVAGFSDDLKALINTLDYSVPPVGMRGTVGSKVNQALTDVFERIIFKDGSTQDILNEAVESTK